MNSRWVSKALAALLLFLALFQLATMPSGAVPSESELATLKTTLERKIGAFDGMVGVYLKHMESGQVLKIKHQQLFPLATLFKFPVLVEMFRQNQVGATSITRRVNLTARQHLDGPGILQFLDPELKPTIHDLATFMITVNDDEATDMLLEAVGLQNVESTMKDQGLNITINANAATLSGTFKQKLVEAMDPQERLRLGVMTSANLSENMYTDDLLIKGGLLMNKEPLNVGTPEAVGILLERIFNRKIINPEDCERILGALSRQQNNNAIPRRIPTVTRVDHMVGNRPALSSDAGIIYLPNGQHLVLVIFTKDSRQPSWQTEDMIAQLSRMIFDHYNRP